MRVFLPLLDNGGGAVKANFVLALTKALNESGLEIEMSRASDSLASRGLNKISADFLASDCDELLIVDCDLIITAQDLRNLFSHDVDLVYGPYVKRQVAPELCLAVFKDGDRPDPSKPLWEVRRAGRGFVRIRRALLEKMKEENGGPALRYHNHGRIEWDFWPCGVVTGEMAVGDASRNTPQFLSATDGDGWVLREFISEDWYFCERARALGTPVYVDHRIMAQHEGDCIFPLRYTEGMLPGVLSCFTSEQIDAAKQKIGMFYIEQKVKSWRDIHGWFDFEDVYRRIVSEIPSRGKFVEVGCYMGKSLAAFDSFAQEAGKTIHLHAVDTFQGEPTDREGGAILEARQSTLSDLFRENMQALRINARVSIYAMPSVKAAISFSDGSLDAVFIDGDHSEQAVGADLRAWWRKIKSHGILAGHDYNWPGGKNRSGSIYAHVFNEV